MPAGGIVYTSLAARHSGTSDYRVKMQITSTGTTLYLTKVVSGTETVLATQAVSGLTYSVGDVLNVRFEAQGSGTTTLRATVWKSGTTEATTWKVTTTDTPASRQSAAGVGIVNYAGTGVTNGPITLSVSAMNAQKLS